MHRSSWDHTLESIRGLAIIAVIGIHAITSIFVPPYRDAIKHSLIIDGMYLSLLFAVPAFLITSGYLWYKKLHTTQHNVYSLLYRRISKLLPLYLIFSITYYFAVAYKPNVRELFWAITHGSINYAYYFIPMIIILYFIGLLIYKNSLVLTSLTGLSIVLQGIVSADTYNNFLPFTEFIVDSRFLVFSKQFLLHIGFFLVGMVWAKNKIFVNNVLNKHKRFLLPCVILGLVGSIGEFLFLDTQMKPFFESHSLARFFSLIYVYAVFFLLYYATSIKNISLLQKFGTHSYIIYLVHLPILLMLNNLITRFVPAPSVIIMFTSLTFSLLIQIIAIQIYNKSTDILFPNDTV